MQILVKHIKGRECGINIFSLFVKVKRVHRQQIPER